MLSSYPFLYPVYSDLDKVQTGIGSKISVFFQWIASFIAGLVVGIYSEFRVALVILAVSPFLVIATFIMTKVKKCVLVGPGREEGGGGGRKEGIKWSLFNST